MVSQPVPVHPGVILREGFLSPRRQSAAALAQAIGLPLSRITQVAREQAPVTADLAAALARYFGTTDRFWIRLQAQHDRWASRHKTIWGAHWGWQRTFGRAIIPA